MRGGISRVRPTDRLTHHGVLSVAEVEVLRCLAGKLDSGFILLRRENVPRLTIDFWEEKLEFEDDRYRKMLGDHAAKIPEATDNPLLEPLIRERKAEGEEYRRLLESFGDDFDGLGEFVEGIRRGYRPR